MSVKRVLFAALISLLVLALLLPGLIGWDAERRYRRIVSDFDGPVKLALASYERGWFSSRARLSLQPAGAGANAVFNALGADGALILDDHLAHGPLPVMAPPGHRWRPALAVVDGRLHGKGISGDEAVARITYRVGLGGGLDLNATSTTPDQATAAGAAWRDLSLKARMPGGSGSANLTLEAGRLILPGANGRLSLEHLRGRLDLELPSSGLPTGTAQLKLERGRATEPGGRRAIAWLEGLELTVSLQQPGPALEGSLEGRVLRLASPRRAYGPGTLSLQATGLDAASLARLTTSLTRLANRGLAGRALAMGTAGALMAEAPALLRHDPEIALTETRLATPEGRARASGRLGLADADPVVLNNPYLLQQAVTGRIELEIPPDAARHAALIHLRRHGRLETWGSPEAWLSGQVERGRLVREKGNYRVLIRMIDGRLEVNGRPWSDVQN